ncbi:uncharacterized protein LOC114264385 isoform X1 [Camellia sinensis]|uniref:uncharacterized protein LOC114264385 isoform X1 n=1 Tax=Camellia sinensis TaxID=4442 RepID=UPI001035FD37|nr:uncharacterized protein LOC114264385 isoform X1 [Camellia sinensis]
MELFRMGHFQSPDLNQSQRWGISGVMLSLKKNQNLDVRELNCQILSLCFVPMSLIPVNPISTENIAGNHHFFSVEKEKSNVSEDTGTTNSDVARADTAGRDTLTPTLDPTPKPFDLNTKVCLANDSTGGDMPARANKLSYDKQDNFATSRAFGWDLNSEDVSSSLNQYPFYPHKNHARLKIGDALECGSTTGSLEEKDPMRVWKAMKQNGFLSPSHGGVPVPKPRGRKSKSDGPKKKMELAKREQVDRFAKIAAPSGLLNELNPGIINHVRNSKQVLSIIESLVRSEKRENRHAGCKQAIPMKSGTKEITDTKDLENSNGLGINQDGSLTTLSGSHQKRGRPMLLSGSVNFNSDLTGGDGDSSRLGKGNYGKMTCLSPPNQDSEDDTLALKLSSSTTWASEDISHLSNESANLTSVSSLSVKAANVASRWLELLYQDIKGRLAALLRSKKRVRAVIHTELPILMSQEFSSNQENNPYAMKNYAVGCAGNANADLHRTRWSALFDQMDKALSEEEKQLESWLNQVKEMQLHCERGLQLFQSNASHGSQWLGTLENDSRLEEVENSERELAIGAAAASIYSTCNFLLSMENLPCL